MNLMIVMGLAIAMGAIIADAIISVSDIMRRFRRDHGGHADGIISDASGESRRPVVFGTLIGGLAVLPVLFLEGASGRFYGPLALSYVVAVAASMVVALIFTPALSLLLVATASKERREPRPLAWLRRGYSNVLSRMVRVRWLAIVTPAALILFGFLAAASSFEHRVTIPVFEERDLRIDVASAPGTSPLEMARMMTATSDELRAIPGIGGVAEQVGRAETGDQIVGRNSGQLWVQH